MKVIQLLPSSLMGVKPEFAWSLVKNLEALGQVQQMFRWIARAVSWHLPSCWGLEVLSSIVVGFIAHMIPQPEVSRCETLLVRNFIGMLCETSRQLKTHVFSAEDFPKSGNTGNRISCSMIWVLLFGSWRQSWGSHCHGRNISRIIRDPVGPLVGWLFPDEETGQSSSGFDVKIGKILLL